MGKKRVVSMVSTAVCGLHRPTTSVEGSAGTSSSAGPNAWLASGYDGLQTVGPGGSCGGALVILSLLCKSFTGTHTLCEEILRCVSWASLPRLDPCGPSVLLSLLSLTVHPCLPRYFLVGLVSSCQLLFVCMSPHTILELLLWRQDAKDMWRLSENSKSSLALNR